MSLNEVKMNEVIEDIKDFLSAEFEVDRDSIVPENNLKDTLDLDSLDYVDLVVLIEENLNIKVSSEDFKGVNTFADFYGVVKKKLNI